MFLTNPCSGNIIACKIMHDWKHFSLYETRKRGKQDKISWTFKENSWSSDFRLAIKERGIYLYVSSWTDLLLTKQEASTQRLSDRHTV